jgi:hypothetical protein
MYLLDSSSPYSKDVLRITEIIFLAITNKRVPGTVKHVVTKCNPPVLQFMTHEYHKQRPIGIIK